MFPSIETTLFNLTISENIEYKESKRSSSEKPTTAFYEPQDIPTKQLHNYPGGQIMDEKYVNGWTLILKKTMDEVCETWMRRKLNTQKTIFCL